MKDGFRDPRGEALQKDVRDLGIITVKQVRVSDIYLLEGNLVKTEVRRICEELLADPVVEEYSYNEVPPPQGSHLVEVAYNPGVIDPVEESVRKGIRDLGITTVDSVRTAKRYLLWGELSDEAFQSICDKLLVNSVIQHAVTKREAISVPSLRYEFALNTVDLLNMDDSELMEVSKDRLWLNLNEMKQIQDHFSKLGRNPTDVEIETLAQTWSEQCLI